MSVEVFMCVFGGGIWWSRVFIGVRSGNIGYVKKLEELCYERL